MHPLEYIQEYLKEVRKYSRLTHEEELELITKAQNGDLEARNKLVNHNLWQVIHQALDYHSKMGFEDYIQQGNIGLIVAVFKYNPSILNKKGKQESFRKYAAWWIRSYMFRLSSKHQNGAISIQTKIGEDETLEDLLGKESSEFEDKDNKIDVAYLLRGLSKREIKLIKMHYGLESPEMTFQEIANNLKITRQRVHQIEKEAFKKIKNSLKIIL